MRTIEPEAQSKAGLWVSEAAYWETYYLDADFHYEWNNGILEEKPGSNVRGIDQYRWLSRALDLFVENHPIARVMCLEMGFRMELKDKTTIRKPDLFVVHHDNPVSLHDEDEIYRGTCDICIEALASSTESAILRDKTTKKDEYEEAGVGEYYILDSEGKHTAFYRQNGQGRYEEIPVDADGVVHSTVLPGFQLRISDLYRRPRLLEMAEDEVYRHFVMPAYYALKERNAQAEAYAEQKRLARSEADAPAEQERLARSEADARAEQERLARSEAESKLADIMAQVRALGLQLG